MFKRICISKKNDISVNEMYRQKKNKHPKMLKRGKVVKEIKLCIERLTTATVVIAVVVITVIT